MIEIEMTVPDGADLRRVRDTLRDTRKINMGIAKAAERLTIRHIAAEQPKRHKTAERLGARPTKAINDKKVTSDYDSAGATVSIGGVAFSRVFHDVTIKPKNGRFLTIPVDAEAYGKRVDELKREGFKFFRPKKQEKHLLWAKKPDGKAKPMYLLVRSVTQRQDRTLLPSDAAYIKVAGDSIRNLINRELEGGQP